MRLIATVHGLPVAFAITGAKADERTVVLDLLQVHQSLATRAASLLIGGQELLRPRLRSRTRSQRHRAATPGRKGERRRPGARFFKPLRQVIESIFDTFKSQLSLEHHQGRTPTGVLQRILAPTAVIWHNDHTGQLIRRTLTPYDR